MIGLSRLGAADRRGLLTLTSAIGPSVTFDAIYDDVAMDLVGFVVRNQSARPLDVDFSDGVTLSERFTAGQDRALTLSAAARPAWAFQNGKVGGLVWWARLA